MARRIFVELVLLAFMAVPRMVVAEFDFSVSYLDGQIQLVAPLQLVVADLDNNGVKTIFVATKTEDNFGVVQRFGVYEHEPQQWGWVREYRVPTQYDQEYLELCSPSIGDVIGGGGKNVVFCIRDDNTDRTKVLIYSGSGALLYDLPFVDPMVGSIPTLADVDGDGINEIFVQNSSWDRTPSQGQWRVYRYHGNGFNVIDSGSLSGSNAHGALPNDDGRV